MNPVHQASPLAAALETAGAWVLALLWVLPLTYALWAAIHPSAYSAHFVLTAPLTVENFVKAWNAAPFARYFLNTFLLVTMILAAQLMQIGEQRRLACGPCAVLRDDLAARAVAADHERIAPHARPADVDRVRHRPSELLLVEHSRRLNLLHCPTLSAARPPVRDLDAARPERRGALQGPR